MLSALRRLFLRRLSVVGTTRQSPDPAGSRRARNEAQLPPAHSARQRTLQETPHDVVHRRHSHRRFGNPNPACRAAHQDVAPKASGRSATANRSTPTSRPRRTTTRSTSVARIENIYAHQGFDSIDKSDLRGRFRWWGLYTQREQGYDGTFTGDENLDLLEAKYFMMRVRCDGGALSAEQLRTVGEISTEFARDTADLSDRENVQYHWIEVENVPEIWRRLEAVGLQTTEACGDCPRVVLGSPLAGESLDEIIDPTPAIDEIVRRYIGDPKYSNLPRKFKTAISGQQDVVHEINDVAFVGVEHPEHGPGLDLWVGGGLSTNPMLAQRVGAWIPLRRGSGRVGSGRLRLPRLRLPAPAREGAPEVPHQGLGHREVPRGARDTST